MSDREFILFLLQHIEAATRQAYERSWEADHKGNGWLSEHFEGRQWVYEDIAYRIENYLKSREDT